MSSFRACQALLLISTLAISPAFGSRPHSAATTSHSRAISSKKGKSRVSKLHGQRVIDSDRATEIPTAVIRQKYLNGEPSHQWDSQTQVAMRQYQSDHGWQTKLTPDSRALISLGLGPQHADAPAVAHKTAAPVETSAQGAEPAENTLASVHSLSQ
jgi:hypothetical protein